MVGTAKWFVRTLFPSTHFHGLSLLCDLVNLTKKEREGGGGGGKEGRQAGSQRKAQPSF